jgi:hypothetical protein
MKALALSFARPLIGAALIVAGVLGASPAQTSDYTLTAEESRERVVNLGCVIRKVDGRWQPYRNGHICIGVKSVTCSRTDPYRIVINLSVKPRGVPLYFIQADETLMARGVDAGISGTITAARAYLEKDGRRIRCTAPAFDGARTNFWFHAIADLG